MICDFATPLVQKLDLCSKIVDCAWNAWVSWTDCEKTATGTCAVQGGGNRERRREHLITEANGGVDCEAASVVENWDAIQ